MPPSNLRDSMEVKHCFFVAISSVIVAWSIYRLKKKFRLSRSCGWSSSSLFFRLLVVVWIGHWLVSFSILWVHENIRT
jgi:hypothetical protein